MLQIWVDGSGGHTGGPGGWGVVMVWRGHRKEINGYEPETTNNRMELMAAIRALEAIKRHVPMIIFTDSQYVQKGITLWLPQWRLRNWKTAGRNPKPVANPDLWMRLDALASQFDVDWRWVRGHNGNPGNERADELAGQAVKFRRSTTGWTLQAGNESCQNAEAGQPPAQPAKRSSGLLKGFGVADAP